MSQPNDDDDGTVIRPTAIAPGRAGEAAASDIAQDGLSLRIGARIAEFEVTGRVGDGGFSIVYLALDHSLERTVALKEYLPASLATRTGTVHVQPRSQRYRDTFEAGLKSFINEAKLLAHFDHPALVKVYRFWEANGTAYMVMPFYEGVTVKDTIRALPAPPDEAWLMALLAPLTEALLVLHAEQCFHRDVAPDNVLLLSASGKPLLLDFGAARRVIGDMTQALTVILKAGYAPVEQYAEVPGMKQGPWTDVYALAAVVYWAITGSTPPASVGRMLSDSFVPLAERAAGRYSLAFLQAIDRALVVRPEQRTQSMGAFRQDLGLPAESQAARPRPMQWNDPDATVIRLPTSTPSALTESPSTRATAVVATETRPHEQDPASRNARPGGTSASGVAQAVPAAGAGKLRMIVSVSALAVAIAAVAVWWALQKSALEPSRTEPTVTAPTVEPPATTEPAAKLPPSIVAEGAQPASVPAPSPPAASIPSVLPAEATQRPAAQTTAVVPPDQRPARPPRASSEAKPERRQSDLAKSEECGRILSRISLGESSPEMIARLKALNCR